MAIDPRIPVNTLGGAATPPAVPANRSTPATANGNSLTDLATEINKHLSSMASVAGHIVKSAIEAGELLRQAKANVEHGDWEPWLDKNCKLSERTARRYMKLAANRKEIEANMKATSATVADFTLRQAQRLISSPKSLAAGQSTSSGSSPSEVPARIIGGNDPAVIVQTAGDKFVSALEQLKQNNLEQAKEKAKYFMTRLKTARLL